MEELQVELQAKVEESRQLQNEMAAQQEVSKHRSINNSITNTFAEVSQAH